MKLTCLVTVHGVGFQQAPGDGIPGYADALHERLGRYLDPSWLGDDPRRERPRRGLAGPIYVQSHWPPRSRQTEAGLARLGTWVARADGTVDTADAPLGDGHARITHVALVYAHPEGPRPRAGASLEAAAQQLAPALTDDVTAYVCRNDLRVQVQEFMREALLRLCCRDDVAAMVVNAHGQGTVLAFDVLRGLPIFMAPKVRGFVTAGTPLRKLVDHFAWGTTMGSLQHAGPWANLWDPNDRVADPLAPPADWRPGADAAGPWPNGGLFQVVDPVTGEVTPATIRDYQVDNVANGPAGTGQAHDYWDNDVEVVSRLAALAREAASGVEVPLVPHRGTVPGALPLPSPVDIEPAGADEPAAPPAAQSPPVEAPADAVPFGLVRAWAGFHASRGGTGAPHSHSPAH